MGILDKLRSTWIAPRTAPATGATAAPEAPAREERRRNKRVNARDETRALIID